VLGGEQDALAEQRQPAFPDRCRQAAHADVRMDRMPAVPERPAGPAFSIRVVEDDGRPVTSGNDYDSFAEAYTAQNESSLINGYYCRPAIVNLAGDIAVISEPPPAPDTPRELFPPEFEGRTTFLGFLFFVLEAG
jgi:hypothetical protein